MKYLEMKIATVIACCIVLVLAVSNSNYLSSIHSTLLYGWEQISALPIIADISNDESEPETTAEETLAASEILSAFNDGLLHKNQLINLSGSVIKTLGLKEYYKSQGVIVASNNYIMGSYAQTSTDYEVEQMVGLKAYCDALGTNLLYVSAPTKYTDDQFMIEEFGINSFINRNAELFLSRIGEHGISYIDLSQCMANEGIDSFDMFYRTDHHWTSTAGLWSAQHIVKNLNANGIGADVSVIANDNFNYEKYANAWLGEQGKKVSQSYVGLDDFVYITPKFETSMSYTNSKNETLTGGFEILMNEKILATHGMGEESGWPSWHYLQMRNGVEYATVINENQPDGKILLLGDSFSNSVAPFLSLAVHQLDSRVLRSGSYKTLLDDIAKGEYDMVIVLYAEFMIGAHDNPNSANYHMFNFSYK